MLFPVIESSQPNKRFVLEEYINSTTSTWLVYFSLLHKTSIALNVYTQVLNLCVEMHFVTTLCVTRLIECLSTCLICFAKKHRGLNKLNIYSIYLELPPRSRKHSEIGDLKSGSKRNVNHIWKIHVTSFPGIHPTTQRTDLLQELNKFAQRQWISKGLRDS